MRTLRNLCYFLIGFLLIACVELAHAETTAATSNSTPQHLVWYADSTQLFSPKLPTGNYYTSNSALCSAWAALSPVAGSGTTLPGHTVTSATYFTNGSSDFCKGYDSGGAYVGNIVIFNVNGCANASGETLSGGSCVYYGCPANQGWTLSGSSCTRPDCTTGQVRQADGTCHGTCTGTSSSGFYDYGTNPVPPPGWNVGCDSAGCTTIFNGTSPEGRGYVNGTFHYYAKGSFDRDGSFCSYSTASNNPSSAGAIAPATCASNQYKGTVNGQTVCVDSVGNPAAPAPTSPGSTTSTHHNPDNTSTVTTTNTTVNNTNNTVTTTTTIINKDANGNQVGQPQTTTDTKPLPTFCEQNPNSTICKPGSVAGGGNCGTPPSCTGDPVQCAVVMQTFYARCATENTNKALGQGSTVSADLEAVGLASMNGTALDRTSLTTSVDVSTGIKTDRFLTASTGLQDQVFTVQGRSVTLPFSKLNGTLQVFGQVLVVIAMIVAARIVGVIGAI